MSKARDEFPQGVRRQLERRVASICSKPGCGRITTGPHTDPAKSVSVGQAGHITSAAPGGPRYDASLTSAQRRGATNGIWLCSACHDIVDADEAPFSADTLREWKSAAEDRAREALELAQKRDAMPAFISMLHQSMELIPERSLARSMPLLMRNVHEVLIDVREACAHGDEIDYGRVVDQHVRARDELWTHLRAIPGAELAYYGIAHVPLAIHMGHLLGTRLSAHHAERERDGAGWRWVTEKDSAPSPLIEERDDIPAGATDVAITVALSYPITREQVVSSLGAIPILRLRIEEPALDLVRSKAQVEAYSRQFRASLEHVARLESVRNVHLFAATPMCLSFALGRQIRGTVHPDVFAYNFRRASARPYPWRLLMTDDATRAAAEAAWTPAGG
ncbi:MAG: SAVED domain-containing protein [Polyangiaceae bacterium]